MKKCLSASVLLCAAALLAACSPATQASLADAEASVAANRFYEARQTLLALRKDEGPSRENALLLAQVHLELGDGFSAERYLTELRDLDGETADWVTMRAHSLILQGSAQKARELIEGFVGDPPEDGTHAWLRVWAAMEEGAIEDAEEIVDAALFAHPQSAPLHAKAARLSSFRGNWDAAKRHTDEALESDPENFEALLMRGEYQIAQDDLEAALATYQLASQTHSDFAVSKANVAGLLLDLDRLDEAGEVLDHGLQMHPEYPLLRFNAARLAALRGDWEAARDVLQTMSPSWKRGYPAATLLEGEVEAALGNHTMARVYYMRLVNDPHLTEQVEDLLALLPDP